MVGIPFWFLLLFNRNSGCSPNTTVIYTSCFQLHVFIPVRIIMWLLHKIIKNILCNNEETFDILTEKTRNQENTYTQIRINNTPGKWVNFTYVSRQWF